MLKNHYSDHSIFDISKNTGMSYSVASIYAKTLRERGLIKLVRRLRNRYMYAVNHDRIEEINNFLNYG